MINLAMTHSPIGLALLLSMTVTTAFNVMHNENRSLLFPTRPHVSTSTPQSSAATIIHHIHIHHHPTQLHQSSKDEDEKNKGLTLEQILQPWKLNIPDEYRNKLLTAEANTAAGKERKQRMNFFTSGTLAGIAISSANIYLTTIREYENLGSFAEDMIFLNEQGYDWLTGNPVLSFFLLNGIGGGIGLFLFGICGTMIELEQRTKTESVQKIWDELVRRRESKEEKEKSMTKKKRNKKKKRLDAFSELMVEDFVANVVNDSSSTDADAVRSVSSGTSSETSTVAVEEEQKKDEGSGILGKLKGFYAQADSMAASQALLLNKKLEEEGLVEKITDESGLRVIGKESACKLQGEENDKKEDDQN